MVLPLIGLSQYAYICFSTEHTCIFKACRHLFSFYLHFSTLEMVLIIITIEFFFSIMLLYIMLMNHTGRFIRHGVWPEQPSEGLFNNLLVLTLVCACKVYVIGQSFGASSGFSGHFTGTCVSCTESTHIPNTHHKHTIYTHMRCVNLNLCCWRREGGVYVQHNITCFSSGGRDGKQCSKWFAPGPDKERTFDELLCFGASIRSGNLLNTRICALQGLTAGVFVYRHTSRTPADCKWMSIAERAIAISTQYSLTI